MEKYNDSMIHEQHYYVLFVFQVHFLLAPVHLLRNIVCFSSPLLIQRLLLDEFWKNCLLYLSNCTQDFPGSFNICSTQVLYWNTGFFFPQLSLLTKSGEFLGIQVKVSATFIRITSTTTKSTATSSTATSTTTTSSFPSSTTIAATASSCVSISFEIYWDVNCLLDTARCLNFFLYDLK